MKHGGDDDYNGTHQFVLPVGGSDHGQQVEDTSIATTAFPSNASISSINVQISGGDDVMNNEQQQKPRKKRSCSRMMRMEKKSVGVVNVAKKATDTSAAPNNMTRQCTECGKKFWSWKALFGHMRCHPERQWRGINPPPNFRRPFSHQMGYEDDEAMEWTRIPASAADDYEVAACLLLLANANPNPNTSVGLEAKDDDGIVVPAPPACSSKLGDDEEEETACAAAVSEDGVIIAENGSAASRVDIATTTTMLNKCCGISRSWFECSSCKKVFGSHQALGGHRASHKNVKGCFAMNCGGARTMMMISSPNNNNNNDSLINDDEMSNDELVGEDSCSGGALMEEGHRCSICLRVFSSGQALGGHKRCHWDRFGHHHPPPSSLLPTVAHQRPNHKHHTGCSLDLNFPPPPAQHPHSSLLLDNSSSYAHPNLDLRLTL